MSSQNMTRRPCLQARKAPRTIARQRADFRAFHVAAQGVVCLHLVGVDDPTFLIRLLMGDPLAAVLAGAIKSTLAQVGISSAPMICLTCEHRFARASRPPAFMLFVAGALELPRWAVASGICVDCYRTKARGQIFREATEAARELWPGLRVGILEDEHRA